MFPHKRIKLDNENQQKNAIILSEIDIELGLRKRLAQTLESRIAWASLLLDSLQNETECNSQVSFKDVALTALSAVESSSDILFARDIHVPPANVPSKARLPPKEKPITRSQKTKFLYLRSQESPQIFLLRCSICHQSAFSSLQGLYNHGRLLHSVEWGSHEECVKSCAVPQEELDFELDLEAGVDVGRTMLLPGVKGLFQMAVEGARNFAEVDNEATTEKSIHLTKTLGLHSDSPALAQFLGKEAKRKGIKVWDDGGPIDIFSVDDSTKPRWRKPYAQRNRPYLAEESVVVDDKSSRSAVASSSNLSNSLVPSSSRFHVSCRLTLTDSSLFIPEDQRLREKRDHTHQWMISAESASYSVDLTTVLDSLTVAAIPCSDYDSSVSFPPLVVIEPPFLVVGTTAEPFQARVELMFSPSTSGPGQNGQKVVLEHWVGLDMLGTNKLPTKGDEQVVDIELDKDTVMKPAKTGYSPVNAKSHWENNSNIALRAKLKLEGTSPLLVTEVTIPSSHAELLESLLAQYPMTLRDASTTIAKRAPNIPYKLLPGPAQLNALVLGRRKAIEWARARAVQAAYTDRVQVFRERELCPQFIPLTTGDIYAWMEDNGHLVRNTERTTTRTADELYHSREDTGIVEDYSQGRWCRVCGLGLWAHGPRGLEYSNTETELKAAAAQAKEQQKYVLPRIKLRLLDGKVVGGSSPSESHVPPGPPPFQCQIVDKMLQLLKMPVVDVHRIFGSRIQMDQDPASLLNPRQLPPWSSRTPRLAKDSHKLVSAADPKLTLGVRFLVNALQLPSFGSSFSSPSMFPLHSIGANAADVETNLSPYALLALATRQFIRVLIKEAAEVEKRDKELGVGYLFETHNRDVSLLASGPSSRKYKTGLNAGKKSREKDKLKIQSVKVLTPMHIITGVLSNYVRATALASVPTEGNRTAVPGAGANEGGNIGIAICGCLSRLGTTLEEKKES